MQSREKGAKSPSNRRGQGSGVSLHIDTGLTAAHKNNARDSRGNSPPRTPKTTTSRPGRGGLAAPGRARRARTTTRETFLDDLTPVDLARVQMEHHDDHRHSHDLSLSPRQITRDSLVDNMLLSLDQFSSGAGGAFGTAGPDDPRLYTSFGGDEDPYYAGARNGRAPTHHVHSYSSDFEGTDSPHRTSNQFARGRRSNSSSNFHAGRTKSSRNEINPNPPSQRLGHQRAIHSRSGKGSKGSSANSFDLGYTQNPGNQRWAQGSLGRSSSLDYIQDVQQFNSQIIQQITTTPYASHDYDAAPTPTVPVGPRKVLPLSPEPMPSPSIPQTLHRKRSTRSSKSAYQKRPDTTTGLGLSFDSGYHERDLPPVPAFVEPTSAPAPHVGYGKSKDPPMPSPQLKDKPGFFRRVFGSSKNLNQALEPTPAYNASPSYETAQRPNSKPHHLSNQANVQLQPVSPAPPPIPRDRDQPHVLTKKPSSFFRRRKKSISDAPPPPPPTTKAMEQLLLQPGKEDLVLKISPSPTNSLRMVMKPYLGSPMDARPEREDFMGQRDGSTDVEHNMKHFTPTLSSAHDSTVRKGKSRKEESGSGNKRNRRNGAPETYLDIDTSSSRVPSGTSTDVRYNEDRNVLHGRDTQERPKTTPERPPLTAKEMLDGLPSPKSPRTTTRKVSDTDRLRPQRSPKFPQPDPPATISELSPSKTARATPVGKEEEWVMVTSGQMDEKENRVWLEPQSSEENLPAAAPDSNLSLPLEEGTRNSLRNSGSTSTVYKSATSLPLVQVDDEDAEADAEADETVIEEKADEDVDVVESEEPTPGDRERAKRIYDGHEDFIQKSKAAAWMGEDGPIRLRTRTAYMDFYDFANLNILAALRLLCSRLVLKAESQQVDRIINAFSKRWCECNPNHGFKSWDVVHTITYSLLLLNTDLYLADIESKMTRSQFIKNTAPTIVRVVLDSAPGAFETRPSVLPNKSHIGEDDGEYKLGDELKAKDRRHSGENDRSASRASVNATPDALPPRAPTPLNYTTPSDDSGPLVNTPFHGTIRTWEVQIEIVLKEFYNNIRGERLPLFGASEEKQQSQPQSQSSLAVLANGVLRRSPSILSKAPSEAPSFSRARTADSSRFGTGKWGGKNRSRGRVYPNSALGSSRTSLDDQSSMWSPSVNSSTWSKYSLGKTQTSMSVDSFGSSYPQGDYQQSIGFANALSQAIIREETIGSAGSNNSEELRAAPLLEDESLGLAGAPWAKEGILKHKHHLESVDKKAKDRNWNEVFAVVEKGYMSLFSFSSKSLRNKSRGKMFGGVVGGGNWQDSAESLGQFMLRHTVASALPPPGYSKARPHVFALSLPTGAVHLLQVGTAEIVREFVSTANYWSARLSNAPLVGGISNIEYGWSDAIINNSLVTAISEQNRPSTGPTTSGPRPSLQSSLRSSFDQGAGGVRPRLPGDRVIISDWTPPTQSMRASNLMEQDQLHALQAYVQSIEAELAQHQQLRAPMLLAFTPRQSNASKAMANWEKKSSYLLREIVKFTTYIDSLQAADVAKEKVYREREEREGKKEEKEDIGGTGAAADEEDGKSGENGGDLAGESEKELVDGGVDGENDETPRPTRHQVVA